MVPGIGHPIRSSSVIALLVLIGLAGCAEPDRDRPTPADRGGDRGGRPPEVTPKRIEMH